MKMVKYYEIMLPLYRTGYLGNGASYRHNSKSISKRETLLAFDDIN